MIPIRDENPTRRVPFVNYTLIALNVLVFLWQVSLGHSGEETLYWMGLLPPRSPRTASSGTSVRRRLRSSLESRPCSS